MRFLTVLLCLLIFTAAPAGATSALAPPAVVVQAANTTTTPEPGSVGVRLIDVPAATQNDPRARSYIVDHLRPGTTIERRIQVQNNTGSDQSVRLYAGAAHIEDGAFTVENDDAENELTTWTTPGQRELEMAPGEQSDVLITIDVPPEAPEGEQYAVVWAEVRSPAEADTNTIQVNRVGIRMYLSVGPGNGPPTSFTIDSLTAARDAKGNPEVTAIVTNTGGRAIDVNGNLTLADGPAGTSAGPFPITQGSTIVPDASASVAVVLDPQLQNGPWQATLELTSGLITNETSTKITFPKAGQKTTVPPNGGLNPFWIVIPAVLLALLVATLAVWWYHRRKTTVHTA